MPQNMKQENREQSSTQSTQNLDVVETVGSQSTMSNPTTKTIIHDGKTYYVHPIHTKYGCSKDGYIIHLRILKSRKGILHQTGYLFTTVNSKNYNKSMPVHRFIWEAVNQQIIPEDYQIHHINCNKQDNSIDNLELVTQSQKIQYEGLRRKGMKYESPQNVTLNHDIFYQHNIYTNYSANEMGQVHNEKTNRVSFGTKHPSGYLRITLTQIGLPPQKCYIHRFIFECIKGQIPDKMQINHIDSNRQNNCIYNLELVTRSENVKHAHKAKKSKTKFESIKLDIKMKESDDDFTDEEKQLIDEKYNAMMKIIQRRHFPYKIQLQKHLPNVEFW